MTYATRHGFKALKVFSDSELMVKQIKGLYKVNHPALKELHAKAIRMIDDLDAFEINHVLREKNRDADLLANQAMDSGTKRDSPVAKEPGLARVPPSTHEVNGVVRNGAVVFLGASLPDGTLVKVRAIKP